MTQPVELILLRQAASYLAIAVLLVDADGILLYFNEPAAQLVGHPYEETDSDESLGHWAKRLNPTDALGRPIPPDQLPVAIARRDRCPVQGRVWIRGLDGVSRHLAVTAIPLVGQGGTLLGAMSILWEVPA